MKINKHVIVSFSTGTAVWIFTNSIYAGLICFISGVLIDTDHIIEYIIHYGWKSITFRKVYQACEQTGKGIGNYGFKKLYLIFHTIEVAILLWVVMIYAKDVYLLAIALGYSIHLIMDCIGNYKMSLYSYFIFWRAINNFNIDMLLKKTSY